MNILLLALLALRPNAPSLTPDVIQLGARVVAAEARGESFGEQYAVAATIGNRVRSGVRWWRSDDRNPWRAVMRARLQYATPAAEPVTRPVHRLAFILGALAPVGWTRRAVSFAVRDVVEDKGLVERWGTGPSGLRPIDAPSVHLFFEFANGT